MSTSPKPTHPARRGTDLGSTGTKGGRRLRRWFDVQSWAVKGPVLGLILLVPATILVTFHFHQNRTALAESIQGKAIGVMAEPAAGRLNDQLPLVLGTLPMLSLLSSSTVAGIFVIYQPLTWNVSECIILIEAQGQNLAYYPSAMETQIFTDRAAAAPWGSKLVFIPRSELSAGGQALMKRLDARFAGARPRSERYAWTTVAGSLLSGGLILGLLAFLGFQFKGMVKRLKFIEPSQIQGSIDDLVGMDDIKAEVAQIKDQFERRTEYAAYGIAKPFNVMFSGPAGTGKTKLASYLAKELGLPILFHSAANLETGLVAGGSKTLGRILAQATRRKRCVVFLDEAQDLFMRRGGRRKFDDDTSNTFLSVLDGVRSRNDTEIIWIVASNFNSETMQMDEAMLRRFQMKVDFRLPNPEERLAIMGHYLGQRADKVLPDMELGHLVAVTEGCSPADLETIVNQAGITAVQANAMIGPDTLMQAAERVLVGNVNLHTTQERQRDRRIIAVHEWGHFLVDLDQERQATHDNWALMLEEVKTLKLSLKANARTNALGFVFHKQGANLLKSKRDLEQEVRVLLGGMANEELVFGEDGMTNGAHNDITRVTKLLHHAIGEMGMYRKTRLNFGSLGQNRSGGDHEPDEATRKIMEAQNERLYGETKAILAPLLPLTEHLVGKLLDAHEMSLEEALLEIRTFEAGHSLSAPEDV